MGQVFKKYPGFTAFFALVFILEILGLSVLPSFHMVSKALIVSSLIGFYIFSAKRQDHTFLMGLIFALLGDCFLLFNGQQMFLVGLGSFLLMQICYIVVFFKHRRIPKITNYLFPIALIIFVVSILSMYWQSLEQMAPYVSVYALAITLMVAMAYQRHPKLNGYGLTFIGALLFFVSDAFLAYDRFIESISGASYYIMITYMLAQFFIVMGMVLKDIKKEVSSQKVIGSFSRHKQKS